jgi:tetratricopeptide (TPR) repeat protein
MFDAVAHFLANVAGTSGTLLVLDDLQWASLDALDLLASLMRSSHEPVVRVVGAYRDTEAQAHNPLSIVLADLAHAGLAAHRTLPPLTLEETRHLLDTLLERMGGEETALRDRALQRAGGIPFFVVSCAQRLRLGDAEQGEDAIPWDVAQGIRQRVAVLPPVAREVLGVAALVGRVVPPALLTEVVGQQESAVLAALDAACHARLLVEVEEGYQFAHDLIREVVEADLGAARRAILHRSVAQALELAAGEPPLELLAYHYGRSGLHDKATLYLDRAGDRARAQHAHAAAEGHYRELVDYLDRQGRTLDAAGARVKLGAELAATAHYEEALSVLNRAAAAYRVADDQERLAHVMARIGHVHASRGTTEQGVDCLRPLVAHLEMRGPSHGLAMLHGALAHLFYERGQFPDQLLAAEHAVDLARRCKDEHLLAEAEGRRGLALVNLGRFDEGLHALAESSRLAEAAANLDSLCTTLIHIGNMHLRLGESHRSRPYFERAVMVAEQVGDPAQVALMLHYRGWLEFCTGNWDAARISLERSLALGRQIGPSVVLVRALLQLVELCHCEGAREQASRYLKEAMAILERVDNRQLRRWAQRSLAARDLLEGHAQAAVRRIHFLRDRPGVAAEEMATLLPALAEAHLRLGEADQAWDAVTLAVQHNRARNDRIDLLDALRVQAIVATTQRRWEEAAGALEEGLALARGVPSPYLEAQLLDLHGQLLEVQRKLEAARERFAMALAIFERLGALKDIERVEQKIGTLHRSPQTSGSA